MPMNIQSTGQDPLAQFGKRKSLATENGSRKALKTSSKSSPYQAIPKATTAAEDDGEDDVDAGPELPPDEDEDEEDDGRFFGGGVDRRTDTALDYLDSVDQDGDVAEIVIDLSWLKRTLVSFEKKISKNAELRARYSDDPTKFLESEADLDAEISSLASLTENTALYGNLAKSGSLGSLASLIGHENVDIASAAIGVIYDLLDYEGEDPENELDPLIAALLEADLVDMLYQNLQRLDDKTQEDKDAAERSLDVLDVLADSSLGADQIFKHPHFVKWILEYIATSAKTVDTATTTATEVLSKLLVSPSSAAVSKFVELNGVETFLVAISPYRNSDPEAGSLEEEFVANAETVLGQVLLSENGKKEFLKAEGIELCLLMLNATNSGRRRGLYLLDHLLDGQNTSEYCDALVEAGGLAKLFRIVMKNANMEIQQLSYSIVAAMLRQTSADSPARIRLLAKFAEKNYEKVDKVISTRALLLNKIERVNQETALEKEGLSEAEQNAIENDGYLRAMNAGGFFLKIINVIMAWLVVEDDGARKQIMKSLKDAGVTNGREEVVSSLQAQIDELDMDVEGSKEAAEVPQSLIDYISSLPAEAF